jgi:hypothetical protein
MAADQGAADPITLDLPAAVTAAAESNTVAVPLRAVASLPIEDVRFEFESSFLLPDATRALERIAPMKLRWKGAPITLFGHSDRVGDEVHNKELAGRRVRAVYAMLVRDRQIWEELYQHPLGRDDWRGRPIQHMLQALGFEPGAIDNVIGAKTKKAAKAFQGSRGLPATGNLNPTTRDALFGAYMDHVCQDTEGKPLVLTSGEFLGGGNDPDGKADYQGCGEFNPIFVPSKKQERAGATAGHKNERDFTNASNRRVTLFFIAPGAEVLLAEWPCPRAKDGPDRCHDRFWSDGPARLRPREQARKQRDTHDTYACRFYERLTLTAEPGEAEEVRPGAVRARWSKSEVLPVHNVGFPPATPPTDTLPDDATVELLVDTQGIPDGTTARLDIINAQSGKVVASLDGLELKGDQVIDPNTGVRPVFTFEAAHEPWDVWDKPLFYIAADVGGARGESFHDVATEEGLLRVRPMFVTIADAIADTPAGGGLSTVDEMYELGEIQRTDPTRGVYLMPINRRQVRISEWGSVIRNTYAYHQTSHGDVQCRIDREQFKAGVDDLPTVCPKDPSHPPRSVLYIGDTAFGDVETLTIAGVPSVPRYLAYINTCAAGFEPSFADALISRGTRNVVAFRKYIPDDDAREMARQFYRKWSRVFRCDPEKIAQVYYSVSPPYFRSMRPVLYGPGEAAGAIDKTKQSAVGQALGALR